MKTKNCQNPHVKSFHKIFCIVYRALYTTMHIVSHPTPAKRVSPQITRKTGRFSYLHILLY